MGEMLGGDESQLDAPWSIKLYAAVSSPSAGLTISNHMLKNKNSSSLTLPLVSFSVKVTGEVTNALGVVCSFFELTHPR